MMNEIKNIKENAQKVKEAGTPNVPILLFSSNGQETGFDEKKWIEIQNKFSNIHDNVRLIELDSSHYIHNMEYGRIAEESEEFIESINPM